MAPIPISTSSSTAPLSALSRLRSILSIRGSDRDLHSQEWVPEVFRPEEFKPEHLQLLNLPSDSRDLDLLPQQLQTSQFQPEHFVPRQVFGEITRARGGGGSTSNGGSRGSSGSPSGNSKAPVPAPRPVSQPNSPGPSSSSPWGRPVKQQPPAAPKSAPKLPAPAVPYHRPASPPVSQLAPNSGSKPPKPKSKAGPSIVPHVKPKTGKLPKTPKLPKIPGYRPHNHLPHMPTGGSSGGHSKHGDSNKLGGCNVRCRNALLGTFGAITLLGFLGLMIFCIFRRKRKCKRRDTERGGGSRSYADGRKWWKQGQSSPELSEDGMELTTHTARGVSFTISQVSPIQPQVHGSERSTGSYHKEMPGSSEELPRDSGELGTDQRNTQTPIPFDRPEIREHEWNALPYRENMLSPSETPQMHSQEQNTDLDGEGEWMSTTPDRSSDSFVTARSSSPCGSRVSRPAQIDHWEHSTSSSGVRKPISIKSDKSSCEDPIPSVAQCARVVRHPPAILTIAGMQAFRAGECELQRRNARRNSDRPDMSESRHQSLKSESSDTFVIGEGGDEANSEDTYTAHDDEEPATATDDEQSRGRTGQRKFNGSARMRGEEWLKE